VRRLRPLLQSHAWWQADETSHAVIARWTTPLAMPLNHEQWNDPRHRALALHLHAGRESADTGAAYADCLLLINASAEDVEFNLPAGLWLRHIDSASGEHTDKQLNATETVAAGSIWLASTQPLFTPPSPT